jgi:hypothetical protein
MAKPAYAKIQRWNNKWGLVFLIAIFGGMQPFHLTLEAQPWWTLPLDCFVILMSHDLLYYLMHRYLFHDAAFLGGSLMRVHALRHRQHNPCRMDSSYIHLLEVALALSLYVASIFLLSLLMGRFHVATIIFTWIALQRINLLDHHLWKQNHVPFKYFITRHCGFKLSAKRLAPESRAGRPANHADDWRQTCQQPGPSRHWIAGALDLLGPVVAEAEINLHRFAQME